MVDCPGCSGFASLGVGYDRVLVAAAHHRDALAVMFRGFPQCVDQIAVRATRPLGDVYYGACSLKLLADPLRPHEVGTYMANQDPGVQDPREDLTF